MDFMKRATIQKQKLAESEAKSILKELQQMEVDEDSDTESFGNNNSLSIEDNQTESVYTHQKLVQKRLKGTKSSTAKDISIDINTVSTNPPESSSKIVDIPKSKTPSKHINDIDRIINSNDDRLENGNDIDNPWLQTTKVKQSKAEKKSLYDDKGILNHKMDVEYSNNKNSLKNDYGNDNGFDNGNDADIDDENETVSKKEKKRKLKKPNVKQVEDSLNSSINQIGTTNEKNAKVDVTSDKGKSKKIFNIDEKKDSSKETIPITKPKPDTSVSAIPSNARKPLLMQKSQVIEAIILTQYLILLNLIHLLHC